MDCTWGGKGAKGKIYASRRSLYMHFHCLSVYNIVVLYPSNSINVASSAAYPRLVIVNLDVTSDFAFSILILLHHYIFSTVATLVFLIVACQWDLLFPIS